MIVVDHTDMSVRGWVGSVDMNDDSRFGHVDMVNAIRSPGSVLKPFIVDWRWMTDSFIPLRCCRMSRGEPEIIDRGILTAVFMAR